MEKTGSRLIDLPDGILAEMAAADAGKGGDRPFEELSKRYRPKGMEFVKRFASAITDSDAEDIVQESMIKAYRNIRKFDGRFAFSTWFFRICQNTAIDFIRRKKLLETESIEAGDSAKDGASPSPEDSIISTEGESLILKMIRSLPEDWSAPASLRYIDGLSYKQIAERLDISESAVKTRLYRARRKLASMIE